MAPTFPIKTAEQRHIIAACISLSLLPAASIGLRIWARKKANRKLDLSDWFIIASCLFLVGHWIEIMCASVIGGMGYMGLTELTETYGPEPMTVQLKVEFASIFVVLAAGLFYKLSVLALYGKILPFPVITILSRIIGVLMLVWYFATWMGNIFIEQPVAANWDLSIPITWEGNVPAFARSIDAMTIMTDIAILALPFKYLVQLHMPFRRKFALIFAFSLGILTVVISIVRLYLNKWDENANDDLTVPFIWEGLEPSIGIVAACIPTLRPLLGRSKYTRTGTMQPRSRRTPMSYETRVLDEIDKDTSSLVKLRPLGPEHSTNITSRYSGDMARSMQSPQDMPMQPVAIHVKSEWRVSSGED